MLKHVSIEYEADLNSIVNQKDPCAILHVLGRNTSYKWGVPVAEWAKRWPANLADRVRFPLEAKSS